MGSTLYALEAQAPQRATALRALAGLGPGIESGAEEISPARSPSRTRRTRSTGRKERARCADRVPHEPRDQGPGRLAGGQLGPLHGGREARPAARLAGAQTAREGGSLALKRAL